jgi:hypothetical protein
MAIAYLSLSSRSPSLDPFALERSPSSSSQAAARLTSNAGESEGSEKSSAAGLANFGSAMSEWTSCDAPVQLVGDEDLVVPQPCCHCWKVSLPSSHVYGADRCPRQRY